MILVKRMSSQFAVPYLPNHSVYPPSVAYPHPPTHAPPAGGMPTIYSMLNLSRVSIRPFVGEPVSLPPEYRDVTPAQFDYDFKLELETITQSQEHRESADRAALVELERAERMKEELKKERLNRLKEDETMLVDLHFDEPPKPPSSSMSPTTSPDGPASHRTPPPVGGDPPLHKKLHTTPMDISSPSKKQYTTPSPPSSQPPVVVSPNKRTPLPPHLSSQANVQAFERLVDMGFNPELVQIAMEIYGSENEIQLVEFIGDMQKLEAHPEKFTLSHIKQALVLFPNRPNQALEFLKEFNGLLKQGVQESRILDALSMYNNDTKKAKEFLMGLLYLKELSFSEEKIKEALLLNNNDTEKAVQYLLDQK